MVLVMDLISLFLTFSIWNYLDFISWFMDSIGLSVFFFFYIVCFKIYFWSSIFWQYQIWYFLSYAFFNWFFFHFHPSTFDFIIFLYQSWSLFFSIIFFYPFPSISFLNFTLYYLVDWKSGLLSFLNLPFITQSNLVS